MSKVRHADEFGPACSHALSLTHVLFASPPPALGPIAVICPMVVHSETTIALGRICIDTCIAVCLYRLDMVSRCVILASVPLPWRMAHVCYNLIHLYPYHWPPHRPPGNSLSGPDIFRVRVFDTEPVVSLKPIRLRATSYLSYKSHT